MTPNSLESAGLSAAALRQTVDSYRAAGSPESRPGTISTENLCAAVEVLASRLDTAGRFLSALQMIIGPTADLAATISASVCPPAGEASALVAAALGIQSPVLLERLIFGHPDVALVSHASIDEVRETFSCTNYLVHRPAGTVHVLPEGRDPGEAARRLEAGEPLSAQVVHRE